MSRSINSKNGFTARATRMLAAAALAVFGSVGLANAQIYTADFSVDGGFEHETDGTLAGDLVSPFDGTNFELSFSSTPGSDTSLNYFRVNGGVVESQDFGGEHTFLTDAIDVSSLTEAIIDFDVVTMGSDIINGSSEFLDLFVIADGTTTSFLEQFTDLPTEPAGTQLGSTFNFDVSSFSSIQVGLTADINGGGDGFVINSLVVADANSGPLPFNGFVVWDPDTATSGIQDGSGVWDENTTNNFNNNTGNVAYDGTLNAQFGNGTGGATTGTQAVTIDAGGGTLTTPGITFADSDADYTLSGDALSVTGDIDALDDASVIDTDITFNSGGSSSVTTNGSLTFGDGSGSNTVANDFSVEGTGSLTIASDTTVTGTVDALAGSGVTVVVDGNITGELTNSNFSGDEPTFTGSGTIATLSNTDSFTQITGNLSVTNANLVGTTLSPGGAGTAGTLTFDTLNMVGDGSFTSDLFLDFDILDFDTPANNDLINITSNLVNNTGEGLNFSVDLASATGTLTDGETFTLIQGGNLFPITGTPDLSLSGDFGTFDSSSFSLLADASSISLLFTENAAFDGFVVWDPDTATSGIQDGSGTWDTTNTNFNDSTGNVAYDGTLNAQFGNGTGGAVTGAQAVTIDAGGGTLTAPGITFANSDADYTLSGDSLEVTGNVIANDDNSIIDTDVTFAAAGDSTVVADGSVSFGDGTGAAGSNTITNDFEVVGNGSVTIASDTSVSGAVDILSFDDENLTLTVDGDVSSITNGNFSGASQTVNGSGTVGTFSNSDFGVVLAGDLTVTTADIAGGELSPGGDGTRGTLTIGDLNMGDSGGFTGVLDLTIDLFDFDVPANNDLVTVTNTLTNSAAENILVGVDLSNGTGTLSDGERFTLLTAGSFTGLTQSNLLLNGGSNFGGFDASEFSVELVDNAGALNIDLVYTENTAPQLGLDEVTDFVATSSASTAFFSDGGGDYFGISDGAGGGDFGGGAAPSGLPAYTGFNSPFLVGEDLDGEGASLPITIDFDGIDISGLSNLQFSGLFAATGGGWDAADLFLLEYRIDGGEYQDLLRLALDGSEADGFNGPVSVDTDFDGIGDGQLVGLEAQQLLAAINGTGSLLDLRLTTDLNSGAEAFALDEFAITVIPEPGTGLLLLAGGGLMMLRDRRKAQA